MLVLAQISSLYIWRCILRGPEYELGLHNTLKFCSNRKRVSSNYRLYTVYKESPALVSITKMRTIYIKTYI